MNKIIFLICSLCFMVSLQGQYLKTPLNYTISYDANGNRLAMQTIYLVKSTKELANNESDTIPQYVANHVDSVVIPIKGWNPGKEDNLSEGKISIYPNPTHGIIILGFDNKDVNADDLSNSVKVFDLQGKLVYQKIGLSQYSTIDLSKVSNGTYILKLSLCGQIKEYKIIKN